MGRVSQICSSGASHLPYSLAIAVYLDMPALVARYIETGAELQGQDAWAPESPVYCEKQALWAIGRAIHGTAFVDAVHGACTYESSEDWQAKQSRVGA